MQRYEIATLTLRLGTTAKAVPAIEAFVRQDGAKGTLLGCWTTDIGPLNQVIVLRGFETEADAMAERARTLHASNPFGSAEYLTELAVESYAPFPFLPPVVPASLGPIYEIRTYLLKQGGLAPTLAAWEAAVPGRSEVSPLTIALYALDGVPRITHIWPYASLNERSALRADSVTKGVWPPKGGPDWLQENMRSLIAMPTAISPLK